MLTHHRDVAVLLVALAIFACRAALSLALIPPWQQPDEPMHFANIELRRTRLVLPEGTPDPGREGEILHSMARYGWWSHRGLKAPEMVGDEFDYAGIRMNINTTNPTSPALYYRFSGRLLSFLPRMSVVDDLYLLRSVSAVFSMLTLVVAWLGARACLGATGGATVVLLLALHPQFAIVSTAVSADAMVNLLGAGVWWQAVLAIQRKHLVASLAVMWLAAFCAALADRSAFPLLLVAFAASVVAMAFRVQVRGLHAVVVIIAVGVIAALSIWLVGAAQTTFTVLSGDWFAPPVPEAVNWGFFWRFSAFLFQSWWSSLGWVRYFPPSWWTVVAFLVAAIAIIGIGRRFLRESDARLRTMLILALMSIAIQLFAVYWAYFRLGNGAQGKSLFPVLVPAMVLLWAGLEACVPPSRRGQIAVAVVLLFALLDAAVWMLVAIPAYATS